MYNIKYSDCTSTSPIFKQGNDSVDKKDNENVKKLALALNELKKYENYDDAYDTAKKMLDDVNSEQKIRMDKVNLAKKRIKSRFYFKKEIVEKMVDNLLREIGLEESM